MSAASRKRRIEEVMASVKPEAELVEDDAIALLLAKEAARRRERASGAAGVSAYLGAEPSAATNPAPVNKTFLRNVIGAVAGHNRRNQEEQCWRQKRLDETFVGGGGGGQGAGAGAGAGAVYLAQPAPGASATKIE